jgi:hypothetical protein
MLLELLDRLITPVLDMHAGLLDFGHFRREA